MTFGERLTQLRKEKGFSTRNELADLLDIPSTTLRNYETDAREPGHSFLIRISELFDVSIDYLLGATTERERISAYSLKSSEIKHIKKYRDLDDYGRETVNLIIDRETARTRQIEELKNAQKLLSGHQPELNAAHLRTDIDVTEEMQLHDDAIMDDDSEWE